MIYEYTLAITRVNNTEVIDGSTIIHDAIIICTENPNTRLLIMNTTDSEHQALSALALDVRPPTQDELDLYNNREIPPPKNPETLYVEEILKTSPSSIPMPDTWRLLRIFAKRLGYRF